MEPLHCLDTCLCYCAVNEFLLVDADVFHTAAAGVSLPGEGKCHSPIDPAPELHL